MIVYVNANVDSKENLIKKIGNDFGIGRATALVNNWYETYSEFVYESSNAELIFFKKRYAGYWESDKEMLEQYRAEL